MTACQKKSQKSGFEPAKMDICNISTNTLNLKVKLDANETVEGKKGAEKKKTKQREDNCVLTRGSSNGQNLKNEFIVLNFHFFWDSLY